MLEELKIRECTVSDSDTLDSLYSEAFPDEEMQPLVRDLLLDTAVTTSLVGAIDSQIVGHVIFTKCGVAGRGVSAALLGPLAIAPTWQRRGVGRAIVHDGLGRLKSKDISVVCVLGDPAYYKRLGFLPEVQIEPPYSLPAQWDGAWQSQWTGTVVTACSGKLLVPRQWLEPALWAP